MIHHSRIVPAAPRSRPGKARPARVVSAVAAGTRGAASRVSGRGGFTLVELLAVMTIIGIILGFVLVAGMDAANRANERATQALITKLDQAVADRLEALLQYQPVPNWTHGYLAAIYNSTGVTIPPLNKITQTQRAQVFALYDYIKSEMPDVFIIDPAFYSSTSASSYSGPYPFNFAAALMPGTDATGGTLGNYAGFVLPLGNSLTNNPGGTPASYGDGGATFPSLGNAGAGIYGAAYEVAAGLYKNLGYLPTGYDGIDNDQDGFVDNWGEGVNSSNSALITTRLTNHTHATARAEMLYALLVSGSGPLGSIFNPDDFTEKEVQDTDGDGMPEFVDAWAQPLQFFRWPLLYHSDLQRGQMIVPDTTTSQQWDLVPPYYDATNTQNGMMQEREQDPLDVNQQLVAPGWWANAGNGGIAANTYSPVAFNNPPTMPSNASGGVQAFASLFHTLVEPYPSAGGAGFWDRGSTYGSRRAFYTKFLILSGGPDKAPGVFLYSDAAIQGAGVAGTKAPGSLVANATQMLISNENSALPFGLDLFGSGTSSLAQRGVCFELFGPGHGNEHLSPV